MAPTHIQRISSDCATCLESLKLREAAGALKLFSIPGIFPLIIHSFIHSTTALSMKALRLSSERDKAMPSGSLHYGMAGEPHK